MGRIAKKITENIYNKGYYPLSTEIEKINKAELAILKEYVSKSAIAKLGRDWLKETRKEMKNSILNEAYFEGGIIGVKELLARIKKL